MEDNNGTGDKKRIMLVEDDFFISDIYQVKLREGDVFDVTAVENGLEALKKMEGGFMPDLILLDIMMPYMDGLEFLRNLRAKEEWKSVPVILLTNLYQKEQVDEGMRLGASDYLIKSHFTPSEVMAKVRNLLQA
jgi:DNA-binding response OmpR family regulator